MNQIADILNLAAQAIQQNVDAVLATVVRTEGSAYRQPGAMMLICADGRSVGMISGGCLEPHIIKRAFWLTRNGTNVQVYQTGEDTTYSEGESEEYDANLVSEEEDGFFDGELNFGLGCNGRVHVLFERLETAMPMLDVIRQVRTSQRPATIATLIKSNNAEYKGVEVQVGTRIYLETYLKTGKLADIYLNHSSSGNTNALIDNMALNAINKLSKHKFHNKNAEYIKLTGDVDWQVTKDHQFKSESELLPKASQSEWLFQQICPQIRLLICGAGNDVMPLVTMAKLQDWHVTVIDSRPQYATRLRFSQADRVMCLALDDTETLLKLSAGAAIAVMSHSLTQDRARLAILLKHPAQYHYLGQLGPRYRTERLIKEISEVSANPHSLADGIGKLYYPIGYKLGGEGPEALALSIMAQISAVMHNEAPPDIFSDGKDQRRQTYLQSSAQTQALLIQESI